MVFYDQLGSGQSTHLRDAPEGFWTVALFMDELENLLKHLGIADNFNLLGHSWGGNMIFYLIPALSMALTLCLGVVAGDYATHIPNGLKRLIISHSPSSVPMLGAEINRLLEAFPKDFVDLVRKHERDGTQSSTEYKSAVLEFYRTHVYILPGPWPELLVSSLAAGEEDGTVFHAVCVFSRGRLLLVIEWYFVMVGSVHHRFVTQVQRRIGRSSMSCITFPVRR